MKKINLNYIYFGFIFVVLSTLTILNFISIYQLNSSKFFFLLYSFGQILLEISIMITAINLSKKYFPKILYILVIGASFAFFLTHIFDFFLNRILDLNFTQTLGFVIDESFTNLIEMFHASGIPLFVWVIGAFLMFLTPFLGYLLFVLCDKISNKVPLHIKADKVYQALFCLPLALIVWDINASRLLNANDYTIYLRLLPWNRTFFQPKGIWITTNAPLKHPKSESAVIDDLNSKVYKPLHMPNIYLFIAESLRDDFITNDIAPNLYAFKQTNIHFKIPLSNANDTTDSWFSIFYSKLPYQKTRVQKAKWKIGSPALYYLKKLGYKIHVHTSAALAYYGMEELLFGYERFNLASFNSFPHYPPLKSYETDARAINAFNDFVSQNKEDQGHVHIFFLDSTHFDYSYPETTFTKFAPISASLSFFKAYPNSNDLEKIKNRYRNSIYYLDSLFKNFTQTLRKNNLYDSSVIIFTGDHGEEFMEHGHMFHCSELNKEQTTVPIFYKFGNNLQRLINKTSMTCHLEIFPSVFDYLFGENLFSDVFEGNSIFDKNKWPYVMSFRYNASRAPYEFFIHNGKTKLVARFKNQKDIFASKELQIVSIKDLNENYIYYNPKKTRVFIEKEFKDSLDKICEKPYLDK